MTLTAIASDPLYSGTAGVVIGVLLGGLIGYLSSYRLLKLQQQDERRVIALGFKKELKNHRDWLSESAKAFRDPWPPVIWEIRDRQIITDDSLYYVLRKEMFRLSSSTVDGLLTYYSSLRAAEEERRKVKIKNTRLMNYSDIALEPAYFKGLFQPVAENIEAAAAMIPDLLQLLEKDGANEKDKGL